MSESNLYNASDGPVHKEFRKVVRDSSLHSVFSDGPFVLVGKLRAWLEKSEPAQKTWLERLLQENKKFMKANENPNIRIGEFRQSFQRTTNSHIVWFAILATMGIEHIMVNVYGKYNDDNLPLDWNRIEKIFRHLSTSTWKDGAVTQWTSEFEKEQWRFTPRVWEQPMHLEFQANEIVPVTVMSTINRKGGVAVMSTIKVPEEYIGHDLRKAITAQNRETDPKNGVVVGPTSHLAPVPC